MLMGVARSPSYAASNGYVPRSRRDADLGARRLRRRLQQAVAIRHCDRAGRADRALFKRVQHPGRLRPPTPAARRPSPTRCPPLHDSLRSRTATSPGDRSSRTGTLDFRRRRSTLGALCPGSRRCGQTTEPSCCTFIHTIRRWIPWIGTTTVPTTSVIKGCSNRARSPAQTC
jgi:hypothetical protein